VDVRAGQRRRCCAQRVDRRFISGEHLLDEGGRGWVGLSNDATRRMKVRAPAFQYWRKVASVSSGFLPGQAWMLPTS
jgi:hypothetical protein